MRPSPAPTRTPACLIALLVAAGILLPGCNQHKRGIEVETGYHLRYTGVPIDDLVEATEAELSARGYTSLQTVREGFTTRVDARGAEGRTAVVRLRVEDGASRMLVRVEPGHERGASLDLINAILDRTGRPGTR